MDSRSRDEICRAIEEVQFCLDKIDWYGYDLPREPENALVRAIRRLEGLVETESAPEEKA